MLLPFDCKEKIAESGTKFHGYKNHRQLAEQMKNAYYQKCISEKEN